MAFDPTRAVREFVEEIDDPNGTSLWEVDWNNPAAVAAFKAEIDARIEREEPGWAAKHRDQSEDHWGAALAALGVVAQRDGS